MRPDQHRAEARSRTVRLNRDQVLVVAGAGLEFPSIAVGAFTAQLLVFLVAMLSHVNIRAATVAAAHQHVAEGLQFVLIKSFDLFRRVVTPYSAAITFRPNPAAPILMLAEWLSPLSCWTAGVLPG